MRTSLGPIAPEFVRVQALVGEASDGRIARPVTIDLKQVEKLGNGAFRFAGVLKVQPVEPVEQFEQLDRLLAKQATAVKKDDRLVFRRGCECGGHSCEP